MAMGVWSKEIVCKKSRPKTVTVCCGRAEGVPCAIRGGRKVILITS